MDNQPMPKCPQCGALLPPNAPAGLCPQCLMALNLETETAFTGEAPEGQSAQPPLPPEQIAPHFPQLEMLECLGRGGMGVVYKARQKSLNRLVALKLLAPERAGDPQFAARFEKEARALAALNHPNIVTIHDLGLAGGFYYLLMEFVDGVNLRQLLHGGRVSPREALAIVPQICDALQYAHDQGIVHRDIKPENILLDRLGRVKVADFGLAKIVGKDALTPSLSHPVGEGGAAAPGEGPAALTDAGKIMGTPQYMSPEQIEAPGAVDHRADIYALGVVFYQMLTGELPGKKIEPPSKKVAIDVRLDEVVLRALEKKPELRYQQASVLKTQVETIVAEAGKSEVRGPKSEKPPRFSRAAIAGAALVAAPVLLWVVSAGAAILIPPRLSEEERNALQGTLYFAWFLNYVLVGVAVVGTTTLGWVAVSQIRRSAGKLHGLWLAVFDGLLFPLLVLDAGIWLSVGNIWRSNLPQYGTWLGGFLVEHDYLPLLMLPVLCAAIDYWIIHRVWRAVNEPRNSAQSQSNPPTPALRVYLKTLAWLAPLLIAWFAAVVLVLPRLNQVESQNWELGKVPMRFGPVLLEMTASSGWVLLALAVLVILAELAWPRWKVIRQRALTGVAFVLSTLILLGLFLMIMMGGINASAPNQRNQTTTSATSSTAAKLSFGPIIERVVNDDRPGATNFLIDLDSGRLVTPPSPKEADWNWTLANGIDAIGDTSANVRGLLSTGGTVVLPVVGDAWESFSVSDVRQIVVPLSSTLQGGVAMPGKDPLPATFVFKTREDRIGLLQITGFTNNPPGVIIRYKLVELEQK